MWRHGRCDKKGRKSTCDDGGWWVWLILPAVFILGPVVRDIRDGVRSTEEVAATAGGWLSTGAEAVLSVSLAGPIAHVLADALHVSFFTAYGVVASAIVFTGALVAASLLMGRRRASPGAAR